MNSPSDLILTFLPKVLICYQLQRKHIDNALKYRFYRSRQIVSVLWKGVRYYWQKAYTVFEYPPFPSASSISFRVYIKLTAFYRSAQRYAALRRAW